MSRPETSRYAVDNFTAGGRPGRGGTVGTGGVGEGRQSREREIRRLALTNPTVAAALGLVDNNGLPYVEALECAVLELAALPQLPDRLDDDTCVVCRLNECPGLAAHPEGAA